MSARSPASSCRACAGILGRERGAWPVWTAGRARGDGKFVEFGA